MTKYSVFVEIGPRWVEVEAEDPDVAITNAIGELSETVWEWLPAATFSVREVEA